jgi:RNA polymerase sigma-70 factor (ECF subfamily)
VCPDENVSHLPAEHHFSNDQGRPFVQRVTMMAAAEYAMDFSSEAELLTACRRQDVRAFEQLYQAHGARLKSIAFHILGNRQDAEDAVQDTFLKLYRAIGGFQGESSVGTWLCRIVINVCYDLARKRKRETELIETEAPRVTSNLRVALESALRRLNPRHRMVFILFEVEGLKHAEIASILEVPEGTSKSWLFEAKKELKRLLAEARS